MSVLIQLLAMPATPCPQNLIDEKSPWECTLEKVTKVLLKLHPDGPIPLDVFDSSTKLVKHGKLGISAVSYL